MRLGYFDLALMEPENNLQTAVSAALLTSGALVADAAGATPAVSFVSGVGALALGWLARQARTAWARDNCLMASDLDADVTAGYQSDYSDIMDTLSAYGLAGVRHAGIVQGHVITRHLIGLPKGTKLGKLPDDDIARDMGVPSVTVTPNAGRGMMALDVPRADRQTVDFAALMGSQDWADKRHGMALPVCPAVDVTGKPFVFDLKRAVHLFVAGTTGSGKSVLVNAILLSLMQSGADFRLLIGDGKGEDFAPYYDQSKHLLHADDVTAIETEVSGIAHQVAWLEAEMDRRFAGADKSMPIVLVIDELADVLGLAKQDKTLRTEERLQRLAQKGRSSNIHMILCTQSPNSEIFGQTFRANIPSAIGLKTKTADQSKVAIQSTGCEKLLNDGDAFAVIGAETVRIHGAFVTGVDLRAYIK